MIKTDIRDVAVRVGHAQPGPHDPFIGRREELAALVGLLHGTTSRTRTALVSGEAGIGKTRLVDEFLDWARADGARVLHGHCYETQEIQPYFPILQVIDQLRLKPPEPQSVLRELAEGAPQIPTLLAGVGAIPAEAHAARTAFLRALCDVILRTADDSETVICIEDVHWADEASLLLLNYLLDLQAPGLLVVCTGRLGEFSVDTGGQLLARLIEKSTDLRLQGLRLPEFQELMHAHTEPGEITSAEVEALHEFTGGSPLLARELLAALRERGTLRRYTLPASLVQADATPARIALVLDLRLASLDTASRDTLAAASVIGTEFAVDLLAALVDGEVEAIEDALASATAKGIVQSIDTLKGRRYRFSHPLYRLRAYEKLSPSGRRRLHRLLAESGETGLISVDELASHYAEGFGIERSEQAIAYCREAAEHAEGLFAYETAAHYWQLAVNCGAREPSERAALYTRLGWALWSASKWPDAVNAWSTAIELLEGLGDSEQVETLALALGETHRMRAEDQAAERWLQRALAVPAEEATHRARALALLASIHALRRRVSLAGPLIEQASSLSRSGGRDPMTSTWLAMALTSCGRRSEAYAVAKRGLREAQQRSMRWPTAMLAGSLVMHELGHLRLKTARSYTRVVASAIPEGNTMALQRAKFCQAWLLAYEGEWRRLIDFATEWMAEVRFAGDFQVASARMFVGQARLALGECADARAEFEAALPHLDQTIPIAAMSLARVDLLEGDEPAAHALARRYAPRLLRDRRATAVAGLAALGDVAADLDDPKLWSACYRALVREEWPLVIAHAPVSVQRVLGKLATSMKAWQPAKKHFDIAIEQLQHGGARWELGRACADAATMFRMRRRRGDAEKAAALSAQAQVALRTAPFNGDGHGRAASSFVSPTVVLTGRQAEVLALVARGLSNQEIADALTLSHRTVERHLEEIRRRFGARSRAEAVAQAIAQGLIEASERTL